MKVEIVGKPETITYGTAKNYRGRIGHLKGGPLVIIAGGIIGPAVIQELAENGDTWTGGSPNIELLPEGTVIQITI